MERGELHVDDPIVVLSAFMSILVHSQKGIIIHQEGLF